MSKDRINAALRLSLKVKPPIHAIHPHLRPLVDTKDKKHSKAKTVAKAMG